MKITCIVLSRTPDIDITYLQDAFDEVIVLVDSEATSTKKPHLRYHKLEGDYAAHRNVALDHARNDWVFFLDEDETAPQALIEELHSLPEHSSGFTIARQDTFMGRTLRHGETGNIRLLRLGNKKAGKWARPVHEVWEIDNATHIVAHAIMHKPHASIEAFIEKLDRYTSIEADYRRSMGNGFSVIELLIYPLAKFFLNYVLKLGFLDGFPGLSMAYMMSLHSLIVRVKMYETPQA